MDSDSQVIIAKSWSQCTNHMSFHLNEKNSCSKCKNEPTYNAGNSLEHIQNTITNTNMKTKVDLKMQRNFKIHLCTLYRYMYTSTRHNN